MSKEVIKADKEYRRKIIALSALLAVVGLVILVWIFPLNPEALKDLEGETIFFIVKVLTVFLMLCSVTMGLYFFRFSKKILKHEQIPPPGVKVIKDTPVIRGKGARVRGYILQVISGMIILGGIIFGLCIIL